MEKLEKIVLSKGATSVIEFDFTGLNMPEDSTCQFVMKKKINDDVICKLEFKESKKYYVIFRDEFTAGLDRMEYRYDIMLMVEDERYRQSYTSDIVVEKVVNEYTGPINNEAVEIITDSVEDVEVSQSVKITNTNVIIVKSKMQEKNVIPTKEKQVITPDLDFTGLSKVNVEKIPDEYVIPVLQDKTINVKPGDYYNVMADEGFDGLRVVNAVGIVDVENVEITPTKEEQNISRSEGKYIENVKVNAIPDNYIEPSGELNITENGNYDVTENASVNVDIQPNLGTKTITENGIYNASDEGLDGYSSVEVTTSGVDINDYFVTTYDTNKMYWVRDNFYYNAPDLYVTENDNTIAYLCASAGSVIPKVICGDNIIDYKYLYQNVTATQIDVSGLKSSNVKYMQYMFQGCSKVTNLDLSHFITSNVTDMSYMFKSCSSLTELDLSNFVTTNVTNMSQMFYGCSKLTSLDIRNFDFTKVTSYSNMFNNVPANCEIIVKDETAKEWVLARRSDFTNVKTVAELGG